MKKLLIVAMLLLPFIVPAQQVAKSLTASNGQFIGFYEYKPTDYNTGTRYPLIIFLHGIGERGDGRTNLPLVATNGIPQKIRDGHNMRFTWNGKTETFLVLSPQLSNTYGDWQNFYVEEMINYAINNLSVDPNRIFLTGLSLGGGGVWRYATSSPTNAPKLAAIAPVCGTCAMSNASTIVNANLPVWAFHAQDDGVVGAGCTTSAITSINNLNPATKPLMHIYPSGGHAIWWMSYDTQHTYHDINMYEWFLGQNKSLAANRLPNANAGADQTINSVLGTATLSAAGSSDPDGNIVKYTWTKKSGPGVGSIVNAVTTNGITSLTGLITAGTYVYEVKVVDNRGGTSFDQVTITAQVLGGGNQAPVANAGPDQTTSNPSVNLNGSSSYDNDGGITSYAWTKTSGPTQYSISNASIASPTVSGLVAGTYQFTLTVRDQHGATGTDVVQINIGGGGSTPPPTSPPPGGNQLPIANAGANFAITLPNNSVNVNAYSSYDPDGQLVAFNWSKIAGPQATIGTPSNNSTSITNLVQGTYQFKLTISDNAGATASDTITITVNPGASPAPGGQAPFARAGNDQTITLPNSTVTLSGWNSYDPDGQISSWLWTKVSGPSQGTITTPTQGSTTVTNLAAGTYTFQLTVTDNSNTTNTDQVVITVNGTSGGGGTTPPGTPGAPIARAGSDATITLPTNSATLRGWDSYDPNGTLVAYNWSKVSGPAQGTITDATQGATSVTNLAAGTYTFRLQVTDNSGLTAIDDMTITVNGTGGSTPPPATGAPIARAGADVYIALPNTSATLRGWDSYDPNGQITTWAWSKLSGPSQGYVTNPGAGSTTVTNLAAGTYYFKLQITDNSGLTDTDTVMVNVASGSTVSPTTVNGEILTISSDSLAAGEKFTTYPNPAITSVNMQVVTNEIGQSRLNVYDAAGQLVSAYQFYKSQPTHNMSITVSDLKSGTYIVELVINNTKRMTTKFIKQ